MQKRKRALIGQREAEGKGMSIRIKEVQIIAKLTKCTLVQPGLYLKTKNDKPLLMEYFK